MESVIVHYQEIALKGRNRPWFIERLVRNLRDVLTGLDVKRVRPLMGRIEVVLGPAADWEEVSARIGRLFGVANFARARRSSRDIDELTSAILTDLADRNASSFRVTARRADKTYPLTSPQIERQVGARVKADRGWRVDLSNPELVVRIEVLASEAFYSLDRHAGRGGLPSGTSGHVMCLLSGGIDSPVAAYRMMKRGCRVRCVHFHSYPLLSHASQDKVRELVQHLTRHQLVSRLYLVAFGECQRRVVLSAPPALRVVLYRRLMMRIAECLAGMTKAGALVTGDKRVGWLLTPAGIDWARERTQLIGDSTAKGTSVLSVADDRELRRLRQHRLFGEWQAGSDSIPAFRAADAVGLPADAPAQAIARRITELQGAARAGQQQDVEGFLKWLRDGLAAAS